MALCPQLQFFLKLYLHTLSYMCCSRRQSTPVHTVRAELAVGAVPARRLQANRKLRGPAGVFPLSPRGRPGARSRDAAGTLSAGWSPRVQSARRRPGPPAAPLGRVPGGREWSQLSHLRTGARARGRGEGADPRVSADLLYPRNGKAVFNVGERLGYW